jgi:carboxypeptidase-like protein
MLVIDVCGQTQKGIVVDGGTARPLSPATIVNLSTRQSAYSDIQGNYELPAKAGDTLSFSYSGYHPVLKPANPYEMLLTELLPLNVDLQEHVVHNLTPFQKDSIEMTTMYSKELNTKPVKIGFSSANGGGVTGLIGAPVKKMSRSYKRNKKFKENFKQDMEQKYIDTRYTPSLVASITRFTGDSVFVFINSYPMEYNFARTATDLELKMWIRNNYKEYIKSQTPNRATSK